GIAWVRGATVEAFVPQMINFEVLGGVSFKKGCYPGQEVVARSQYRGTLKRRLQLFETDSTAAIGQEIFHSADPEQPAGVVAGAGTRDGRTVIAAEIKLAALEGGSLHLGSAGGATLQPRALPYEIPPQE
ncbi:MAG: tRNA-modifying protein YgfZ, partial [Burkholderiaceae bacterium]|nr:tRNA-modifying protein YgfZ [Burkholderiaceae bacterium]